MKYLKLPSILVVMALVMALCLPAASAVSSVGVYASASGTTVTANAVANNISGTAYYTWRIRPNYSGGYTQVSAETTSASYTFTGLSYNTTYLVSVSVRDSASTQTSAEQSVVTNYDYNYNWNYGWNYGYNNGYATVTSNSVSMYSSASSSSSVVTVLNYGAQVYVHSTTGSFAYVSYNGYYGYVYYSSLSNWDYNYNYGYNNGYATVISNTAAMYSSASSSSSEIFTLNYGTQVYVHSYSGSFSYVSYNGYYGYVYTSSLTDQNYYNGYWYDPYYYGNYGSYSNYPYNYSGSPTGTATVTAYSAAVYYGPSGNYGIMGYLSSGATVTTYNTSGDFTAINYAGSVGYILSSQLSNVYGYTAVGSGAYINNTTTVRGAASSYGTTLGTVNTGTYVTVYSVEGSWTRINWGSGYGYVPSSNISYTTVSSSPVSTPATGTKTVIADLVNVRDTASVSGRSLGTLTRGAVVSVSSTSGGWVYVTSGSIQGWVYGENLR